MDSSDENDEENIGVEQQLFVASPYIQETTKITLEEMQPQTTWQEAMMSTPPSQSSLENLLDSKIERDQDSR